MRPKSVTMAIQLATLTGFLVILIINLAGKVPDPIVVMLGLFSLISFSGLSIIVGVIIHKVLKDEGVI